MDYRNLSRKDFLKVGGLAALAAIEASCASRLIPRNHVVNTSSGEITEQNYPLLLQINDFHTEKLFIQQIDQGILGDLPHLPFAFVHPDDTEIIFKGDLIGIEPKNIEKYVQIPVPLLLLEKDGQLVPRNEYESVLKERRDCTNSEEIECADLSVRHARKFTYISEDLPITDDYNVRGIKAKIPEIKLVANGSLFLTEDDFEREVDTKEILGQVYLYPYSERAKQNEIKFVLMPYDKYPIEEDGPSTTVRIDFGTKEISYEDPRGIYELRNLLDIRTDPLIRAYVENIGKPKEHVKALEDAFKSGAGAIDLNSLG